MKKFLCVLLTLCLFCGCQQREDAEKPAVNETVPADQQEVQKEEPTVKEVAPIVKEETEKTEVTPTAQPEQEVTVPIAPPTAEVKTLDEEMLDELYDFGRAQRSRSFYEGDWWIESVQRIEYEDVALAAPFVNELKEILVPCPIIQLNEEQEARAKKQFICGAEAVCYDKQILAADFEPHLYFYGDFVQIKYQGEIFYAETSITVDQQINDLLERYDDTAGDSSIPFFSADFLSRYWEKDFELILNGEKYAEIKGGEQSKRFLKKLGNILQEEIGTHPTAQQLEQFCSGNFERKITSGSYELCLGENFFVSRWGNNNVNFWELSEQTQQAVLYLLKEYAQ